MGFDKTDDWYKISQRDILTHGGGTLLAKFNGSPATLVKNREKRKKEKRIKKAKN